MKLSIVSTLYQSAPYIKEFVSRISKCATALCGEDFEIILVNDGSPDNSLEIALKEQQTFKHINVIDLTKNYGHHNAIMAGLKYTQGEFVFLIDIDLEEKPEDLERFWKKINEKDSTSLVVGIQEERRQQGVIKDFINNTFYALFDHLTGQLVDKNEMVIRLMKRKYVECLLQYDEYYIFLPGIWNDVGMQKEFLICEKSIDSPSSYSLKKKVSMAINAITSFSNLPLYYIFFFGFFILCLSTGYGSYIFLRKILFGVELGWASLIISVWFLGGVTIAAIGLCGIYLSKIYYEVKKRPRVLVQQEYLTKKD